MVLIEALQVRPTSSRLRLPSGAQWDRYLQWNDAIEAELFAGQSSDRPIYLAVEPEQLKAIALAAGAAPNSDFSQDFINVIKATIDTDGSDPLGPHIQGAALWLRQRAYHDTPPCLAVLAFFSLVAQRMSADAEYASNNYYDRLFQILSITQKHKKEALKASFRQTRTLWAALNTWLQEWGGDRGLATARSLDHRVFVSIPQSQALLRTHDRARLHELFAIAQLVPGQRMSTGEMIPYLRDWVSDKTCGQTISKLWSRGQEVRDRIADIACHELQSWDGAVASKSKDSNRERLVWFAQVHSRPIPFVALIPMARDMAAGNCSVTDGTNSAGNRAVENCDGELRFEESTVTGANWVSVEPYEKLSIAEFLGGRLALRDAQQRICESKPKAIVLFRQLEQSALYQETNYAQLMHRHFVVAHESLKTQLLKYLDSAARPNFKIFDSKQLRGLPSGWIACVDVELTTSTIKPPDGMDALQPLSEHELIVSGGLRLSRDTWHSLALPEVKAAVSNDLEFSLTFQSTPIASGDESGATFDHGRFQRAAAISLDGLQGVSANYQVSLFSTPQADLPELLSQTTFRVRKSGDPKPLRMKADIGCRYVLAPNMPLGSLSASGTWSDQLGINVAGTSIAGQIAEIPSDTQIKLGSSPSFVQAVDDTEYQSRLALLGASIEINECSGRGYHIWKCEDARAGDRAIKQMFCNGCGTEKWLRDRGRKSVAPIRIKSTNVVPQPTVRRVSVSAIQTPPAANIDLILDALSYLHSGSWDQFKDIAHYVDDRAWFAHATLKTLAALGHVDVHLDTKQQLRPENWAISPACIVAVENGRAVLSGYRSQALVAKIVENVHLLEGTCTQRVVSGLSVVEIINLSEASLELLAAECSSASLTVRYVGRFSKRIVKALPSLSTLKASLPLLSVGKEPLQRFDFARAVWRDTADISSPGAYRMQWHGQTYGYVSAEDPNRGYMRVADPYVVKHLAAQDMRIALIGYDPVARTMKVPIGCNLPGLFERVAAMASGLPPTLGADNNLHYLDVDTQLAQELWARLST